jgi:hypothetical protein
MVRETMQSMPAKEIRYRLEMLLKRETDKLALDNTLENEWMEWA